MQSFDNHNTGTSAAIDAGQCIATANQTVQYLTDKDGNKVSAPFIIDGEGKVVSLDHLLDKPFRHKAKPVFADVTSFIAYLNKYKSEATLIFGTVNEKGGTFRAALDIAPSGDTSWNDHSAAFALQTTPDWKLWSGGNKVWMNQEEFVLFVDAQRHVFSEPKSATMKEIANSLEGTIGGAYKSSFRAQTGDRTLVLDMTTVVSAKRGEEKIEIPEEITIILPIFEGQNPVQISAFLRFRATGDGVKFQYELQRSEEIIRVSAEEARDRIAGETGLLVLNGVLGGQ